MALAGRSLSDAQLFTDLDRRHVLTMPVVQDLPVLLLNLRQCRLNVRHHCNVVTGLIDLPLSSGLSISEGSERLPVLVGKRRIQKGFDNRCTIDVRVIL